RDGHAATAHLRCHAAHTRTMPVPGGVRQRLDDWFSAAGISSGSLFRRVQRTGRIWGKGLAEKAVWHVVKEFAGRTGITKLAPHDLRSYAAWKNMPSCPLSSLWFADFLFDDSA